MIPSKQTLNDKLELLLSQEKVSLGLAEGKMGYCIYFYHFSSISNRFKEIADKLLDEIFKEIDSLNSIDVKNGLAGIGLGINCLIKQKYVEGDINVVLKDIDEVIFKKLLYTKYSEKMDSLYFIHLLYYLCVRLKQQEKKSENEYLYQELIIQTLNILYENLSENFPKEPFIYNSDYILPQLLFVFSEMYKLGFYNYRLSKIIEELSYYVFSTFPILHSNRLYLLWGMDVFNKQFGNKIWEKHIVILNNQIVLDNILNNELRSHNIFFNNGLASVHYFANSLRRYFGQREIENLNNRIYHKIDSSEVWNLLIENDSYFRLHCGLNSGFTGLFLLLNNLNE